MWDKESTLEHQPPVPVTVDGQPPLTHGHVVPDGNNPYVVVSQGPTTWARKFSWQAVIQALNDPRIKLPLTDYDCPQHPSYKKPWTTPQPG